MWELRSERNLIAIVSLYREAIDEDPCNYPALVGLSRSLIVGALMGVVDGFVAYPSATEALRRVPRDSSEGTDALCAAAWLKTAYGHRWREARAAFEEVLRKKPTDSFAMAGRALLYVAEGKLTEAFEYAWSAWSENPLAAPLSFLPSWIQYLNQDYEDALDLLADSKASGAYSSLHAAAEALILAQFGTLPSNLERIDTIAAEYPQSQVLEGVRGYSYAATGHSGKAWEVLGSVAQAGKQKKRGSSYLLALILLGLGEKQEALVSLERSFSEGSLWSLGFRSDPILQPLRGERHFEALLRRIGPTENVLGAISSHLGDSASGPIDCAEEAQHGSAADY
jgi:tetratricopeptide (TPR) repeat protein